jgi:multidrug efflux system membrane fusion protein
MNADNPNHSSNLYRRESAFIGGYFFCFCAALLGLSACSQSNSDVAAAGVPAMPPVAVRAVTAISAAVPLDVNGIGNVEAITSVDVKSRVTAPVLRVNFQEGQNVQKGELLFELDPEVYNRQIAELEANVAKDVANEKESQANIEKDQATLKNAVSVAERGKQLLKQGIFSREQTDQVVATADAAKASLDADTAALESAKAAQGADRARLAQTKLSLSFTRIYAPISGRAGAVQVKAGNLVKENDAALVTLLQISPIYVSFSLPENLLPEVRKFNAGRALAVTATLADGSTATGSLSFIDNTVDMTTGTIKLKASYDNPQQKLWPGQFVNVQARLETEQNRIMVPSQTIENGPQGKYVWVMNPVDSTASMRPVDVSRLFTPRGQPEQAVISSGLQPGEMVISEGQMRLAPGAHVRLLKANANPAS